MCMLLADLVIITPNIKQSNVLRQTTGQTNATRGILKDDQGIMVSQGYEVPPEEKAPIFYSTT